MPPTSTTKYHPEPELEYLFSYWATLTPPEVIGPLADGVRANVYVTDGEIEGPKLRGRFRKAGGDWFTLRPDGVGTLDVRGTMELEGGALVYTAYSGVLDLGPVG